MGIDADGDGDGVERFAEFNILNSTLSRDHTVEELMDSYLGTLHPKRITLLSRF